MERMMGMAVLGDEELSAVSGGKGKKKGRKHVTQSATVTQDLSEYLDLSGVSGEVTINGGIHFGNDSATATVDQSA